ncbi:hypothetical protein XA68_14957 [Ophiocordyceps unilateralis]|uniref:SprT-like domain-containing protein n=1 Tax=Ophiocordyceps unilateralis TaxID=268505 RepID=A0A2A9PP70_OPHUN|nr:hypothetical protein XA68_14957 [Ophiocordyceps unilateralis]
MSEYDLSSDDDLPRLENLILFGTAKPSTKSMASATEKRDTSKQLVPKSSSRKVRRLGVTSALAATNPLLLPWNHDGDDSISGLKVASSKISAEKTSAIEEHCAAMEKITTQKQSQPRRAPRRTTAMTSVNGHGKQAAGTTKALLGLGRAPELANSPTSGARNVESLERRKQIHTQLQAIVALSDADDLSSYQTAAENPSGSSDDESGSEFAIDEFHGQLEPRVLQSRDRSEPCYDSAGKRTSQRALTRGTAQLATLSDKPADLSSLLDKLRIDFEDTPGTEHATPRPKDSREPETPCRGFGAKGLVSPHKLIRIPQTSFRPSTDAFWSQDFVDDWNDQHSPRKKLSNPGVIKTSLEASPSKTHKRSFDAKKRLLADEFLRELDIEITQGRISELAESTGGVKLVWTKTLNTTAGRANWRRETTRTKPASGTPIIIAHAHHASIELAEKVIDNEDKLLNVLAHEFCHLANFMISGVTNNPHGKEFKAWAEKCSRAFGDSRGIRVTTKHTYEIDFKYMWACTVCGSEYKRHSKSIDPRRHRCGSCKGLLAQTKPVPREGGGAAGGGSGVRSGYQVFVKEQMKIVRGENPGSPQKEVMKIVAGRWTESKKSIAMADKSRTMTDGGVVNKTATGSLS